MSKAKLILLTACALSLATQIAWAQKEKPWAEWSRKDAEKMLNDSPWAKTQTDTESSQRLFSRTASPSDGIATGNLSRMSRGAVDRPVEINFRVRFFSARPIRQALVKLMELENSAAPASARLREFAEAKSAKSIVVTLSFDSREPAYLASTTQALVNATTALLSSTTYLERSDGKRVFLAQYVPPGKDGFGARFIFPREVDGAPLLNPNNSEVRFHTEFPIGLEINRRFKVADMIYKGELEY